MMGMQWYRLSNQRKLLHNIWFLSTFTTTKALQYDWLHPLQPPARISLAHLPTPVHSISFPGDWMIKRDDATGGLELGGNKLRKLEFLMAVPSDAVVTIGGWQSNHARAVTAVAKRLGREAHVILRTKQIPVDDTTGNQLVHRLLGAQVYTCTPGEYGRLGSNELVRRLTKYLEEERDLNVLPIPVGGSNAVGTWGYVLACEEFYQQCSDRQHIVVACGSGGTVAGLVLGMALGAQYRQCEPPRIHAVGVCDSPDYFYETMSTIIDDMGFHVNMMKRKKYETTEDFVRDHVAVYNGKGKGYAVSTAEELQFIAQFAQDIGILLDPVYTGKAMYHFCTFELPKYSDDDKFLFWHTGGGLGMYDKVNELLQSTNVLQESKVRRLDVYGKSKGSDDEVDISESPQENGQ